MTITIDPPAVLPVERLSLSSLRLFQQCPERWKRRYLDREYEPPSGRMLLGSAAGAAEAQSFSQQIDTGEQYTLEQVEDEFSAEWDERTGREDVDWGADKPGDLKDSGVKALRAYHREVAPMVLPVSVEREFRLSWPGVDWHVNGYLDVEEDAVVRDLKMRGKRMSQRDADSDLQPTLYLAARRAEGQPASSFVFDTMIRSSKPFAETVTTRRTDRQLDLIVDRLFAVAHEIVWRAENSSWIGAAPGTWFCSTCSYTDCPWRL